ncbi:hypothetical protein C8J57DRAFT_1213806 [Mycena rebaudengoi]|nr:hypothetical protein C8J57DRAFT_1213806 [Mycena rebaudengoi]
MHQREERKWPRRNPPRTRTCITDRDNCVEQRSRMRLWLGRCSPPLDGAPNAASLPVQVYSPYGIPALVSRYYISSRLTSWCHYPRQILNTNWTKDQLAHESDKSYLLLWQFFTLWIPDQAQCEDVSQISSIPVMDQRFDHRRVDSAFSSANAVPLRSPTATVGESYAAQLISAVRIRLWHPRHISRRDIDAPAINQRTHSTLALPPTQQALSIVSKY